jgi:hypothetical protein
VLSLKIESPYSNEALPWLRGNLHAHTTNSDGHRAPHEVVLTYAQLGYDFLMISDHDHITQPGPLEAHGMTLIPGCEVTSEGPHMLHVNAGARVEPHRDRQRVLHDVDAQGGCVTVMCHPNRDRLYCHCAQELLERLQGYTGIEIYNGVTRRSEGLPLATERWDRVLGLGRRVWGFANDDSHMAGDDGVAWNVVQSASNSANDIVQALRAGRFYASTGVTIESVRVEGNRIHVIAPNAERIMAVCDFGRRVSTVDGPSMVLTVPDNPPITYVRFECCGHGDDMAWTQPLFLGA